MSTDLLINFLKGNPLFNNLGPVPLARLAENSVSLKFAKGATILEEGKPCNSLLIVASGQLEAYRKTGENTGVILRILNRGDVFGEDCVMDGSPAPSGLRAAENSVVIGIDRPALHSLARENPEFSRNLIRHLGGRVREAAAREENLLRVLLSAGLEFPDPYSLYDPADKQEAAAPPAGEINQMNAPEDQEEDGESDGEFFRKELTCPLCAARFRTLKPRRKHLIVERADDDFCLYYKSVNPLYYEINVCPKCGYSFNSSTSAPVRAELKKGLAKMLDGTWNGANYCGPRTLEEAVQTFKLAIECQRLAGAEDSSMGRFFLKLGWLYRYLNMKDQEHWSLEKALHHLSRAFETGAPADAKEEMNLMFLLGQIHYILGDERGAVNWFIKIAQHPDRKSYPYIVNRARDKWQEIRQRPGSRT
ncbi:MAG: DUF2225 domain-containing protein [Peptococcaceae bacterium]|nr:DUF2225 domain-containing protein [Peptococcaceae bacterium]